MSAKDLLLEAVSFEGITPVEIKEVPKLDGKIYVRVMTAGERQLYAEAAVQAQAAGSFVSDYEIVAICACEADGTPMFHQRVDGRIKINSEDVAKLVNVNGVAVAAIARKALEISGMLPDSGEKAKKDSASSQTDASSTGSQDTSIEA